MDNETWLIEVGDGVTKKHESDGHGKLTALERLVYWFWWTDYMVRNAGDFANAEILEQDFQEQICIEARQLGLEYTLKTFELSREVILEEYYDRFDLVCEEIRGLE